MVLGTIVEHDTIIADYAQISPHATRAGYCSVGEKTFVSTGVNVIPHISIGDGALVSAGSVVIEDVASYTMVAGCPAIFKKMFELMVLESFIY